ncbi:MAG: glyceraldehyde 3-phosphate dehydrogenase NAD-binding domain-containing protein, partial [Flavobacteriales bacterium]|nr:glyceraldehyde 3-phosphate dehydrogenase NAD-binding domain-containing protein [Flavobacteriales bacterium]
INDLASPHTMSHLFKYDSIHGVFDGEVQSTDDSLIINNYSINYFSSSKIEDISWQEYNVDIVVECTGLFKDRKSASAHLNSGAKKVIISAPPTDDSIKTIVVGINDHLIDDKDNILSNASCTTNSAAPLIQLINENYGIESAYITTIHSYTTDQRLHDSPHIDLRRARAGSTSIVPTTTGAAKALTKIFPDLSDRIGGCGIRVPVPDGSLTDITCIVEKETTVDEINDLFNKASSVSLNGILSYIEDPIVSVDVLGNTHSCVFDSKLTSVIGKMVKVVGWYDNETGYSNRLIDLIEKISNV